jgi:hypothetical protein
MRSLRLVLVLFIKKKNKQSLSGPDSHREAVEATGNKLHFINIKTHNSFIPNPLLSHKKQKCLLRKIFKTLLLQT